MIIKRDTFGGKVQLTLGELIEKLEPIAKTHKNFEDKGSQKEVVFDFEYLFPTEFLSWRGSYDELALGFSTNLYGSYKKLSVSQFLEMCEETVGSVFSGYKGGKYRMSRDTPVWVSNSGNAGHTAIVDVFDDGYEVVLITSRCEY